MTSPLEEIKAPGSRGVPLLVLDVDGTIREGKDDALGRFVNGPEDVKVFPSAVEQMVLWKASGGRIITASNQGGIALGIVAVDQVMKAMEETKRQVDELAGMPNVIDGMNVCPHHPDAEDPLMAACWCRKPLGGLVIEGAMILCRATTEAEFYPPAMGKFVGDRDEDKAAAEAVNLPFEWAKDWRDG